MSTTINTIIREAERLDNRALDDLIAQVTLLRVRREANPDPEASLLSKINKGLPLVQVVRLRELNQKRQQQTLADEEREELIQLVTKTEQLNVNRLRHLTQLARLRNVSVRELMRQLGIGN
jgi:ERCC4-type nuclease